MRIGKWIIGKTVTAPTANANLVQSYVSMGKRVYILGFFISTTDTAGNSFQISWRHNGIEKTLLIVFSSQGTIKDTDTEMALNEDFSADPQSIITVQNLSNASGGLYQASILIGEEQV
jgi:hypothetical protein